MNINDILKMINKTNDTSSYEALFLDEYNKALQRDEASNRQPVPTDYLRPSSIHGCTRMLWMMRSGMEQDIKPRDVNLIGICDSGTDRHERIQKIIAKMDGVICLDLEEVVKENNRLGITNTEFVSWNREHTEARCLDRNLGIYFQPDGVFRFRGKECILEIKTISTMAFSRLVEPKKEHIIQATCYAMGIGVDYILYFYEDRNFTSHKLWLVHVTQAMKDEVVAIVNKVEYHYEQGIVPEKEADKCTYCQYKKGCRGLDKIDYVEEDVF